MVLEDLADMIASADRGIRVAAVLNSVKAAVEFFRRGQSADLIFSDIQLGDGLSFEIFRLVPVTVPIIFCTAYDEFAMEAIRSNGIEYILKPYTQEMIAAAIEKYRRMMSHFQPKAIDFEQLMRTLTGDKEVKRVGSVLVYHRDKILPIPIEDVALFYLKNDLTHLHCFNGSNYVVDDALDELEKLSPGRFFRINRQCLVSRRAVKDAQHYQHRKYAVNLTIHFKEVLVVSKNRATAFLEWLRT